MNAKSRGNWRTWKNPASRTSFRTNNKGSKYVPCQTADEVSLYSTLRAARNRPLPVRLIIEDSREITDDINHSKYQSILWAKCQVGTIVVTGYWSLRRRGCKQIVHTSDGADLGRSGVHTEDEREDDSK